MVVISCCVASHNMQFGNWHLWSLSAVECQCLADLRWAGLDGVSRAGSNVAVQGVLSKSIQSVDIRAGPQGGGAIGGEDQPFLCCTVPRDVRVLTPRET